MPKLRIFDAIGIRRVAIVEGIEKGHTPADRKSQRNVGDRAFSTATIVSTNSALPLFLKPYRICHSVARTSSVQGQGTVRKGASEPFPNSSSLCRTVQSEVGHEDGVYWGLKFGGQVMVQQKR